MYKKTIIAVVSLIVLFDLTMCASAIYHGIDEPNYSSFTPDFQQR